MMIVISPKVGREDLLYSDWMNRGSELRVSGGENWIFEVG